MTLCLLGSEGAELVHLFCKFEAYTSTIGTLSELADSLNSSSVADLAFLLEDIGHLLGIEHQTHSLLGLCYVALDGLGRRLEGDFTILSVISIGSAEWNTIQRNLRLQQPEW